MRVTALVFAAVFWVAGAASAQEWDQYVSTRDGFKIDFPGQPTVSEHMRVLSRAGLVSAKRVKQWTFYKRDEERIARLKTTLLAKI